MLTPSLLLLLGGALLLLLLVFIWHARRTSRAAQAKVTRAVAFLVSDDQLLVMQQSTKGRLRARLEVPKGKVIGKEASVDAARRECYEESGLRPADLQFLVSVRTRQRKRKQRGGETWDVFWGSVPTGTALPFKHRVTGKGRDHGRLYQYRLVALEDAALHPPLNQALSALRRELAKARVEL